MTDEPNRLWATVNGSYAYVHVEGKGVFDVSASLKQFGAQLAESCRLNLILDMQDCQGMDSTFMGVIAGVASRLRKEANGYVYVINLSKKNMDLLCTLGLDQVVSAHLDGQSPENLVDALKVAENGDSKYLENVREDEKKQADTVREAHHQLMELEPENYERFQQVIECLCGDEEPEADTPKRDGEATRLSSELEQTDARPER